MKLSKLLKNYKQIIFDIDGVMSVENEVLNTTYPILKFLKEENISYKFLTNNDTKSSLILNRFYQNENLIELINEKQIFTSSIVTCLNIKENHPDVKKIFLLGRDELAEVFSNYGFEVVSANSYNNKYKTSLEEIEQVEFQDNSFDAVICGYDPNFNYFKICKAVRLLENKKVKFFALIADGVYKGTHGILPGAYCVAHHIEIASERKAEIVTKPSTLCYDLLYNSKENSVFIGDNLTTDILFGNNCGIDTILVMTGVTSNDKYNEILQLRKDKLSDQENLSKIGIPTHVFKNLNLEEEEIFNI